MNTTKDLLIEIGSEELPPKQLRKLSLAFAQNVEAELAKNGLEHEDIIPFATPRRLALLIKNLSTGQESRVIEKRGPALKGAFDASGNPTLACLGFANSCGVTLDDLETRETDKGTWLFFKQIQEGKSTKALLPEILEKALSHLPIAKPMRWGNHTTQFVRPVHWVTLLFGDTLVPATILGQKTIKRTYGHRFHHPESITISSPAAYPEILKKKGFVIANLEERKRMISDQVLRMAKAHDGRAVLEESLLEEVTNLVEWPVALLGKFDTAFLKIPSEAIMVSMKSHQKCFSVVDAKNRLMPYFITVSNIESKDPKRVVTGNERVIRARLSDAKFFFETDLKHTLQEKLSAAKEVIFQKKLGSMFEKSERVANLARFLAEQLDVQNTEEVFQAGLLCKADLMSNMVGEFPELQGIMGYYYALNDGLSETVATAIKEHYQPRFSGDVVPSALAGALVAIADKIDTLIGLFGINQPPSGEKDPFALRRSALGILRILIEKALPIDLLGLLHASVEQYHEKLENPDAETQVFTFMMERLRAWYIDAGIAPEIFSAVIAKAPTQPLDLHHRIQAVQHFQHLPEAKALAAANKRVSRILKDQTGKWIASLDINLSESESERQLMTLMAQKTDEIEPLYRDAKYAEALTALASLQRPVDQFFDDVMVMTENEQLRNNRLALLHQLQQLFLQVADVSQLAV